MCGIVGWIVSARAAPPARTLARMAGMIAHRGPDAEGLEETPVLHGAWHLAFGHRRLAIVDLSAAGCQPFHAFGLALIFNGEIYNYLELREELQARGRVFRTATDTEVLAAAWAEWGAAALPRLRGMFAFALWDGAAGELVLARDAFGKKPLYLAETGGGFAFASEIPALLAMPGIDRDLDVASLGEYLRARYVPGPNTFFAGIKKLPPGTLMRWQDGRRTTEQWFQPPIATTCAEHASFPDNVARFAAVLDESVRLRMRSDAPYGAYLSGGIDSSAIVGLMARHSARPVTTFSVGFEETGFSELPHAARVAAAFGCDHRAIVVRPESVVELLPDAVRARGAPVSEPSDLAILGLSREAGRSVKMVLTGEGSDELLGGYPKHRADRWARRYQRLVPGPLHRRAVLPLAGRLPYAALKARIALAAAGERDPATYQSAWFGIGDRAAIARLLGGEPAPFREQAPFGPGPVSSLRRMLFFDQTSWLPDNLLERGDRMMMAGSVEGRMPFLDIELARLVATFPDDHLTGGRGGKRVLRAAAEGWLDRETLERPKVGFRVPVEQWFRSDLADHLREMLLGRDSRSGRLLDETAMAGLLAEHRAGRHNHEKILWTLLSLEQFLRAYDLAAQAETGAER